MSSASLIYRWATLLPATLCVALPSPPSRREPRFGSRADTRGCSQTSPPASNQEGLAVYLQVRGLLAATGVPDVDSVGLEAAVWRAMQQEATRDSAREPSLVRYMFVAAAVSAWQARPLVRVLV